MTDSAHSIFVPGRGSVASKIMIVGEAPAKNEIEQGKCFVGPTGTMLMELLKNAGIEANDVYFTNAVKYMLGPSQDQFGKKIPPETRCERIGVKWSDCLELLGNEVQVMRPHIIVALGGTALQALTGKSFHHIARWRGSVIPGMGFKVIPTYHPAGLFHRTDAEEHSYWIKGIIEFDLVRAKKQAEFSDFRYPKRLLQICNNTGDLLRFLKDNENETHLSVDIEAKKCIPICIGLAFNPHRAITVPLWGETGIGKISSIPQAELVGLWFMVDQILRDPRYKKVGQNFKYDQDKLRRLGFKVNNFANDTAMMSACVNPELPRALEFLTSIYTEEPYYKDEGMYEGSLQDLFYGCGRDSCVTDEVRQGLDINLEELNCKDFYYDFYHGAHDVFMALENYGIAIDEEGRKELLAKYHTWELEIKNKLWKITGLEVNPNSPQQVAKLIYEVFKLPKRKGVGEEVLTAVLANNAKKAEHIEAINLIMEGRRVRKTKGTYVLAHPDTDGRARSSYFIAGTETGRRSTQMLKPPVRPEKLGVSWHTLTKHGDIGQDIRRLYKPDSGLVFIQADQEQAEARVVALLCMDFELLSQFETIDTHALMASYIFGGTWFDHSKKKHGHETPERFIGKTGKHSTNYDATKRSLMLTINTDARKNHIPINISEWRAGQILDLLHEKNPKIRQVFHKEIQEALKDRKLVNPFGRPRIFYERWGDDLFREGYAQIPQSTVADNTLRGMINVRKKFGKNVIICGESHDAFLMQIDKQEVDELAPLIKQEIEAPIDFSRCTLKRGSLVIPWDFEIGENNYKDLSKYKVKLYDSSVKG